VISALSVVVLLVAAVGAGVAYIAYRNHQIHHIPVNNLATVPNGTGGSGGSKGGVQTFLLIGSTSRCVLNNNQAGAFGSCAQGVTGVNSDVILLLRADPSEHRLSILSIPRDLVLENVRHDSQKFYKVDAALAEGPSQLVAVIEEDFGIPINHFAELNFDTFQNVVNALGGIDMYFPFPESDDFSSLDITTAGCHHLNGFEALAVVRARHLSYKDNGVWDYDGSGDLGRIIRVHEFLRVLANSLQQSGIGNPIRDNAIIGAVAPQLTVDSSLSVSDMAHLILSFHKVSIGAVPQQTLPNIEDYSYYYWNGIDFGSVVLPTQPQDQNAVDYFEGISSPPGSKISPSSISVSVTDGVAGTDNAPATASGLTTLGYHVVGTGAVAPVGPLSQAIVYYSPGHVLDAERVMQSLHGIVSMAEGPTSAGAEVTIVTGTNFSVVSPLAGGHASTSTTSPGGSTTTTTTTANSELSPPSQAVQALPFYDPRACTASQIKALNSSSSH
jgi:LCP family protein required for cell wall assembly